MQLPERLLTSLEGVAGFDRKAFEAVHASGEKSTSIRVNPAKPPGQQHFKGGLQPVPWSSTGYYLDARPSFTFDPLFHAGCYYVQEASSMFLEQALGQCADLAQPLRVLDLCAAPGGKSTHLQALLSADSLLVSNEVIRTRVGILKQNIVKWGARNVVVTQNDPQHFARLTGFFDVLVVDAPCSGSGLFRRDAAAIGEWSEEAVGLCCGRQKRIIRDAVACLKEHGLLVYSTCSYSPEEDEDIADWLVQELGMEPQSLRLEESWGIVESRAPVSGAKGYRFFPDKTKGEGFYLACFRAAGASGAGRLKPARLEKATARERSVVAGWLADPSVALLQHPYLYALPPGQVEAYGYIKNYLSVQYAGVAVGEVMKEKLVPEHALALSTLLAPTVPSVDLDAENAVRYLQRRDLNLDIPERGWLAVSFQGHNLGWINALPNRLNNYYPKELRILKEEDDTAF